MSLREEIKGCLIGKIGKPIIKIKGGDYKELEDRLLDDKANDITSIFEKRIDEMIGVDNQTINMKNGSMEGKIAAQASKNTLTLVKEMLK